MANEKKIAKLCVLLYTNNSTIGHFYGYLQNIDGLYYCFDSEHLRNNNDSLQ